MRRPRFPTVALAGRTWRSMSPGLSDSCSRAGRRIRRAGFSTRTRTREIRAGRQSPDLTLSDIVRRTVKARAIYCQLAILDLGVAAVTGARRSGKQLQISYQF